MKKRGLSIILVSVIILSSSGLASEPDENTGDNPPRVFFVPSGDFYESIDPQNLFSEAGFVQNIAAGENKVDRADFDRFLKEMGVKDGVTNPMFDPTFVGPVDRKFGARLIYDYIVEIQSAGIMEIIAPDVGVVTLEGNIGTDLEFAQNYFRGQLSGDSPIDVELGSGIVNAYFEGGYSGYDYTTTPDELRGIISSDLYRDYREAVERRNLKGWYEFLPEEQKREVQLVDTLDSFMRMYVEESSGAYSELGERYGGGRISNAVFSKGNELQRDELLRRIKAAGMQFDPGKDRVAFVYGYQTGPMGGIARTVEEDGEAVSNIKIYPSSFFGRGLASHELLHTRFYFLEKFCDSYTYPNWAHEDTISIKMTGKGCYNTFDSLGCCAGNPRWKMENGFFDREAYLRNLEVVGLDENCLPRGALQDSQCAETAERYHLCFGNPCEVGDPHPPYCRDVMSLVAGTDIIEDCFDGELEYEILPETANPLNSTFDSPSQR